MKHGRIQQKRKFQESAVIKTVTATVERSMATDLNNACFLEVPGRSMCIQVNGGGLGKWHLLTGTQMHWQPRDPMLDQEQMVSAGLNGID